MSFPQADPASSVRPPHVEWYTVRASSPRYRTTSPRVRSAASRKTAGTPSIPSNTWSSTLAHDVIRGVARLRGRPDGVRPHGHRQRRERLRVEPRRRTPG